MTEWEHDMDGRGAPRGRGLRLLGLAMLAAGAIGVFGAYRVRETGGELQAFSWPDGRFEVLLPAGLVLCSREMDGDAGAVRFVTASRETGGFYYFCAYVDCPEQELAGREAVEVLAGAAEGLVRPWDGQIVWMEPVQVQGAEGLEVRAEGEHAALRARLVLDGERLIEVAVGTRPERVGDPRVDEVLGSLRLRKGTDGDGDANGGE